MAVEEFRLGNDVYLVDHENKQIAFKVEGVYHDTAGDYDSFLDYLKRQGATGHLLRPEAVPTVNYGPHSEAKLFLKGVGKVYP